jgi:uncharacterized protein YhdP
MNDTALNERGEAGGSHWVRRSALVVFCLWLVGTLGIAFTRVVAARVPEQRATLEKLITDRTGLAVRFENVHFAWGLDGTSAVFTRVELTDQKAGRVRVVAPELRVEFDTWDFLRHHQFSLGHVTLSSPDIEIIGEPDEVAAAASPTRKTGPASASANDERALIRRYTAWATLMPNGRIEVEGARVHLLSRGQTRESHGAAYRSFTLSQAVVSRGSTSFSAYGTMLLSQDVGQSLFVSAKLDDLSTRRGVSGELRVIARRVFLDKLPVDGLRGRGSIDAKLQLVAGRLEAGSWQASARELTMDDDGPRFDHLTVNGKLTRDGADLLLDLTDLQLTRGARLERAPNLAARLTLDPATLHIARTRVHAERLPFMGAELVSGLLAPQLSAALPASSSDWAPTTGELHDLEFDSGERRKSPDAWTFSARMNNVELTRATDNARLSQLAALVHFDARELTLDFDPRAPAALRIGHVEDPRPVLLGGRLTVAHATSTLRLEELSLRSGASSIEASGAWDGSANARPLALEVANVDRALLADAWTLFDATTSEPALLARLASARVVTGTFNLQPAREGESAYGVDWARSRGKLELAALTTAGESAPRLLGGSGTLTFARGAAQLKLAEGHVEDLALTAARLDWPSKGDPRLVVSLNGPLSSPLFKQALAGQGLDRLTGLVSIEAEARGARELEDSNAWRISARLTGGSVPLAKDLPPLEKLAGTIRWSEGQLRALALEGTWLGGPVELDSRRAPRGQLSLAVNGTAEAAPLLKLLGESSFTRAVSGQLAWSGTALRTAAAAPWQLSLTSNLVGLQSDLPEPFDKPRARALPLSAELELDTIGVREFELGGRDFSLRGQIDEGATQARFEILGVAGEVRRGADPDATAEVALERLDTRRAPAILAAAAALLPLKAGLSLNVADLRSSERSLGALHGALARTDAGLAFSFESSEPALHRISARGTCDNADARCRAEFTAGTAQLASLLRGVTLPSEIPAEQLHASGELSWPLDSADLLVAMQGRFDIETEGSDAGHQLVANATLADGQIQLTNVQGTGPGADQVFRGEGRVGLVARDYDLTVDYERTTLAAAAVPTPARARLARVWNAVRGSAAKRGWAEPPESRRVQWHGYWDSER